MKFESATPAIIIELEKINFRADIIFVPIFLPWSAIEGHNNYAWFYYATAAFREKNFFLPPAFYPVVYSSVVFSFPR